MPKDIGRQIMKKILILSVSMLALLVLLAGCGSPLYQAAGEGDINMVKTLLDQGSDVNETFDSLTPLMRASREGHIEVVKVLLDRGANINAKSNMGRTALSMAANEGHINIVNFLLDRGADLNFAIISASHLSSAKKGVEYLKGIKAQRDLLEKNAKKPVPEEKLVYGKTEQPPQPPVKPVFGSRPLKDLPKIAVWDLSPGNIPSGYAQDLTSILVSEIAKFRKYEVYSQDNVRTLAGWTAERMTLGCTDTKCLTALGQMDIAKLVSGRIGKIGNTYSISLNIFDTQNAKAEDAISEFCRAEDELIGSVQRAVRKLIGIREAVP
jgi:hypothetical protein